MDNENKELKNSPSEAELEEKVRQDVSEKIASAAAELEEEIAEAEATEEVAEDAEDAVEESEDVAEGEETDEDAEGEEKEPVIVGYDEEGNPIFAEEDEEEEVVKEPKWVSLKLQNLVLSLIGAALIGALLLFMGIKVPSWAEKAGSSVVPATPLFQSGKTVVKVEGEKVTEQEMKLYIYQEATRYIQQSGGVAASPAEYDWDTEVEDGKTAGDIVKENAVKAAIENVLLMKHGKEAGVEWDEEMSASTVEAELTQMEKEMGLDMLNIAAQARGYEDIDHYKQMIIRSEYCQAILDDIDANPDSYYPDTEVLAEYAATDTATIKNILITKPQEEAAPAEGEEAPAPAEGEEAAAPAEGEEAPVDPKLLAEEILKKIQEGEDFDALMNEFTDSSQPKEAFTIAKSRMGSSFEETALALGMNEVSGVVDMEQGYCIIKRVPGQTDLASYWRANAKTKINQKRLDALSVVDIITEVTAKSDEYNSFMAAKQAEMGVPAAK